MKFIEVKEGVIIKTSNVETIRSTEFGSEITMVSGSVIDTNIPAKSLLQLIEMGEKMEVGNRLEGQFRNG